MERKRSPLVSGLTLVAIGLVLFAIQYTEGIGTAAMLFLIGGLCVGGYLLRGFHLLLVAGGILMGLGMGMIGDDRWLPQRNFFEIGLGIGFLSIYAIGLLHRGRAHWWPIVPGVLLILAGVFTKKEVFKFLFSARGWPLIIVFIGLIVLLGALGRPGRGKKTA